jgi:hypothetical protein
MRTTRFGFAAGRKAARRPIVLAALIALAGMPGATAAQTAALAPAQAAPQGNGVGSAFELTFWQSVTGSEDTASYEAYLARYPDGTFSGLARARMAALQRAAAAQGSAPIPVATPVPALAPAPAPTPAVLTMPQVTQPLAATPAVAAAEAAPLPPQAAEMIPANTALASAEAAPSPLARLLAQLRGSGQSASASAPMITPAPPVQPLPAAAPAPVQPAYAPAPAPAPQAAAQVAAMAPVATQAVSYASARPLLLPVPEVVMPAYFCSVDARNQFHNGAYRPAVEIATRNNEAAVAYLRQLQQTYDRGQLGRDTTVLNAIAAEARAFQSEAARAYSVQAVLVRQFDALMAVPLRACALAVQ